MRLPGVTSSTKKMKGNFVSFYLKGDLIKVTCRNVGRINIRL